MRLTVVGCTGSLPGPDSPASCYLVTAEGDDGSGGRREWRILLDLGAGALGPLQRHLDPASLDAVLLTHLHPDHCLDACALNVLLRHGPVAQAPVVPVWGPDGVAERLARAYGVGAPERLAGLSFHTLRPEEPVRIGPFRVTPYPVLHPVPAFGLRVEADGEVLAYTGDTDSCPSLGPLMAGADLVLAEASFLEGRDTARGLHLTARRAAEAARDAGGVGRLVLTHLPPWTPAETALAEAGEVWDGPLEVARPGAVLEIASPPLRR